jgi:adenine phosphoribosyltransferase
MAFTELKWIGAVYLVYLGVKMILSTFEGDQSLGLLEKPAGTTAGKVFRDLTTVTALNPKSNTFFIAFVPQFIDPAHAFAPQAALLIATFVGIAAINALVFALAANAMRRRGHPDCDGRPDQHIAESHMKTVKDYIRTIVDFPHEGIMFRDVTTLFADPRGFRIAVDQMLHPYAGLEIDKVVGLEARGFILGGAIAHQLSVGFVPVRKKGKLPGAVISEEYTLEYGEAIVEIHDDAIQPGEKILVVDDLLATGGTAEAGIKLIERLGGEIVSCAFVIDLPELGGRARLEKMGMEVHALCDFEGL